MGAHAERVGRVALEPADRVAAPSMSSASLIHEPDVPLRYAASYVASPPISLQLSSTVVVPAGSALNPDGGGGAHRAVLAVLTEEYEPHFAAYLSPSP